MCTPTPENGSVTFRWRVIVTSTKGTESTTSSIYIESMAVLKKNNQDTLQYLIGHVVSKHVALQWWNLISQYKVLELVDIWFSFSLAVLPQKRVIWAISFGHYYLTKQLSDVPVMATSHRQNCSTMFTISSCNSQKSLIVSFNFKWLCSYERCKCDWEITRLVYLW